MIENDTRDEGEQPVIYRCVFEVYFRLIYFIYVYILFIWCLASPFLVVHKRNSSPFCSCFCHFVFILNHFIVVLCLFVVVSLLIVYLCLCVDLLCLIVVFSFPHLELHVVSQGASSIMHALHVTGMFHVPCATTQRFYSNTPNTTVTLSAVDLQRAPHQTSSFQLFPDR